MKFSPRVPKSAFAAAYTGQTQEVSHSADRIVLSMTLGPCREPEAGERESFFWSLASTGDWVNLWHMQRPIPNGTLRGSPTAGAAASAGARTLTVQTTAGATLKAGDMLGNAGQLLMCAYPGATANGSGVLTMPLVMPLRKAVSNTSALTWDKPTGTFKLQAEQPETSYVAPRMQLGMDLVFLEVFT